VENEFLTVIGTGTNIGIYWGFTCLDIFGLLEETAVYVHRVQLGKQYENHDHKSRNRLRVLFIFTLDKNNVNILNIF
jgi:hypothetical protein